MTRKRAIRRFKIAKEKGAASGNWRAREIGKEGNDGEGQCLPCRKVLEDVDGGVVARDAALARVETRVSGSGLAVTSVVVKILERNCRDRDDGTSFIEH